MYVSNFVVFVLIFDLFLFTVFFSFGLVVFASDDFGGVKEVENALICLFPHQVVGQTESERDRERFVYMYVCVGVFVLLL